MDGISTIEFDGHAGSEARLVSNKIGSNGKPYSVASVNLAVNKTIGANKTTQWFTLQVWGVGRAEAFAAKVKKGSRIEGKGSDVTLNTWAKTDGSTVSSIVIKVVDWKATDPMERIEVPPQATEKDKIMAELAKLQNMLKELEQPEVGSPFVA